MAGDFNLFFQSKLDAQGWSLTLKKEIIIKTNRI